MAGLIIAVDGHSSTGKSTFAKIIARKMDLVYLDSGALYRAVTLYAIGAGLIAEDGTVDAAQLDRHIAEGKVDIGFIRDTDSGTYVIALNGKSVEGRIRMLDISSSVSRIAEIPCVRRHVDSVLHRYGAQGCVMDGRDIGTAVFPDADLKLFMTADARVRARRRLLEMEQKGEKADFEAVYRNVLERDYIDSHRQMNPLRQAPDAVVLDNSDMTIDEQLEWLSSLLKQRFGISL